jgi:hypothetical protein
MVLFLQQRRGASGVPRLVPAGAKNLNHIGVNRRVGEGEQTAMPLIESLRGGAVAFRKLPKACVKSNHDMMLSAHYGEKMREEAAVCVGHGGCSYSWMIVATLLLRRGRLLRIRDKVDDHVD